MEVGNHGAISATAGDILSVSWAYFQPFPVKTNHGEIEIAPAFNEGDSAKFGAERGT